MPNTALRITTDFQTAQAVSAEEAFRILRALRRSVEAVGERILASQKEEREFNSPDGSHVSSRYDLEGTALIVRYVPEFMSDEGLPLDVSFENEEMPLQPATRKRQRLLRLVIDPIDGSKAIGSFMSRCDVPRPRPGSAVSIAAVCPVTHLVVASVVYCFDLGEVYSCCLLNVSSVHAEYIAFRADTLLNPLVEVANISAKRRVLNGNYNSRELHKFAELELALMDRGLNPTFGGLTGSSATDIINVVRGSFAACLDTRALCHGQGSVPYWYDIAGAVGVAKGRGLKVLVTGADGVPLEGGDHAIYTPVSFIVARPDVFDIVQQVVREQFPATLAIAA